MMFCSSLEKTVRRCFENVSPGPRALCDSKGVLTERSKFGVPSKTCKLDCLWHFGGLSGDSTSVFQKNLFFSLSMTTVCRVDCERFLMLQCYCTAIILGRLSKRILDSTFLSHLSMKKNIFSKIYEESAPWGSSSPWPDSMNLASSN